FGLVSWFLSHGVWAKPTTKFVVPYLTLVGLLKQEASAIDLPYAFAQIQKKALERAKAGGAAAVEATRKALELKETLLSRPLEKLVEEPHFLSAWLSEQRLSFTCEGDRVVWKKNPLRVLAETYHLLHM